MITCRQATFAAVAQFWFVVPAAAKPIQAVAGQPVKIANLAQFTYSCEQGPVPWITILAKPANGAITTDLGPVTRPKNYNGWSGCNGRTTKGLLIFYTSNPGFHGADHVQFRADYFPRGNSYHSIDIDVK